MFSKSPLTDHFLERMKKDKCFTCGIEGHWSRSCPSKTPSSGSSSFHVTKDYEVPVVYCCCDLPCVVKEINGVKRFCCSRWKHYGCGHMELFDKVEAPQCTCGAGAASVHKWMRMDGNMGRIYYACRVKKGHGACTFFEWKDTRENGPVNGCVGRSNNYISPQSAISDIQITDTIDRSKGMTVNFTPPHPKRLKFDCLDTEDIHHPKLTSPAQIEGRKHSVADSTGALFVEEADLMVTSENVISGAKSGADHKNLMFSSSNSAARSIAIEGPGKLGGCCQPAYTHPCRLSAFQSKPSSSCVVPNFDAAAKTQSKFISSFSKSSASIHNLVAGSSSHSQGQALDNSPIEPPLNRKQLRELSVRSASPGIAQENWQAVACLKETFRIVLESMDPFDIESTNRKVDSIVGALACLGVDTKPLWEQVSIVSEGLKKAETSTQQPVWKKLVNLFRSK